MNRMAAASSALLAMIMATSERAAGEDPQFFTRPGSTAPFSAAVRAGDFIFASGQIGATPEGRIPESIEEQARLTMNNVRDALATAGASLDDVVKCTVMIDDMKLWADFNKVYITYFKPGRLPARSAFGSNGLALGAGVEVECVAYKPLGRGN